VRQVASLLTRLTRELYTEDGDDDAFDAVTYAANALEWAYLEINGLPAEAAGEHRAADVASAAERPPQTAAEWHAAVKSVRRLEGSVDFDPDELGEAEHGKQPSPADSIRAEAYKYGGALLASVLAVVYSLVARGLTPYHAIGLMTTDSKVYERGLVRKLRSVAQGGELQGMKNPGVDARHQMRCSPMPWRTRTCAGAGCTSS
jgi:hypothetical protein